jgi:hypothetical protein
VDAGCASSIEAIESGEAHAPELAHVATHESTLRAWILSSRGFKECGTISAFRRSQCWETRQRSESGARSFEKVDCDRIARGWLAGLRVAGEHRSSDTSAANQGAMAVLAGSKASA